MKLPPPSPPFDYQTYVDARLNYSIEMRKFLLSLDWNDSSMLGDIIRITKHLRDIETLFGFVVEKERQRAEKHHDPDTGANDL